MAGADLEAGREAHARGAWNDAEAAFAAADASAPLQRADLELYATAAYMLGDDEAYIARLERAVKSHTAAGEPRPATRCAFWIAVTLLLAGDMGAGGGWLGRAERLLAGEHEDCVERAYLRLPELFRLEAMGEFAAAAAVAAELTAAAERFGDGDLFGLACHAQGQMLVLDGRVADGLRLLDEAMLAVVAGDMSPIPTGIVYCGVILGCETACEVRRAHKWTEALTRWCDEQPDMLAFTGRCRAHRAELMQLRGAWESALDEARLAAERCERASNPAVAAIAAYRRGEIHRLRGDLSAAEQAYRDATSHGGEPQPGLALLRVAQGQAPAGAAMLRRALGETPAAHRRVRLLPAAVDALLAVGELGEASAAAAELESLAERIGTDFLAAAAAHARGAIALEAGDPAGALPALRRSSAIWRELGAPYEAARAGELIALACRAMGDEETGTRQLEAARDAFVALGATPDAARVASHSRVRDLAADHGLSARELEVLRLVAGGSTNRAIAAELVLSERTVDRHVSNILAKLRVSGRAAATAYAYEHRLL